MENGEEGVIARSWKRWEGGGKGAVDVEEREGSDVDF